MDSPPAAERSPGRKAVTDHEGFLRHAQFRWMKMAFAVSLACLVGYFAADVEPRPSGGSWYGYTLGTIGALLIVWLALLGVRKRAMTPGQWSLKAWTSAHVYLGLALIVIATLHTGFQLGWNVHTLAYALMMLVIASGVYGIIVYSTLPTALSNNREEMTQGQMIDAIHAIDRQLRDAAQPLPQTWADLVRKALEEKFFGQSLWSRLSGNYPNCATQQAIDGFHHASPAEADKPALNRTEALLNRRKALLTRMRRHMRLKGLLEVWLHVHVPATFALLAALTAHIISVFTYW